MRPWNNKSCSVCTLSCCSSWEWNLASAETAAVAAALMAAAPFAALVPLLLPTEDISDCTHRCSGSHAPEKYREISPDPTWVQGRTQYRTVYTHNFCEKSKLVSKLHGQIRMQIAYIRALGARFRTEGREREGNGGTYLSDARRRWTSRRRTAELEGRRPSPCRRR